MYTNDNRIVITLDAGGTNLVFGAMRGCQYITSPITYPSNSHNLDACLDTMLKGFREVIASLDEKPVAISFAFPGPADYPNGIIGGYLPNFPSFRDGVALGHSWSMSWACPYSSTTTATSSPMARLCAELFPRSTKNWPTAAAQSAIATS